MIEKVTSWHQRPPGRELEAVGERRVWVRFPGDTDATLRTADTGPVSARVRDLSRGGIGLVVDHGFTGGSLLSVELPALGRRRGAVLAYVLRASPMANGGWVLGCVFAAELDDDTLFAMGGRRERSALSDRRTWARAAAPGTARYFAIGTYDLTRQADVENVSPGGIGLVVNDWVDPGAVLAVELKCPGAAQVSTLVGVTSVRPRDDGRWIVGGSFIREMDEAEFRVLAGPGE
jgi:hypothetical protein